MQASFVWLPRSGRLPSRHWATALVAALCALAPELIAPGAQAAALPSVEQPAPVTALAPAEVEEVLDSVPLRDLPSARLGEALAQLPGLSGHLRMGMKGVIEGLEGTGGTLGQLLDALGSGRARQVLSELLASVGEPEQLIEQVLAASNPESLAVLLGSTLAGGAFTKGTVEEVAQSAGTTAEALASDLGTTSSQLPAGAMALTAPLSDGKTLGVLDGLDGLDLGLLGPAPENNPEGGGGASGSGSGSGGSAGSGGSGGAVGGSSTAPGGMTLVVDEPATPASAAVRPTAGATVAKVAILECKARHDVVTLLVRVPAAGRVTIAGRGVRSVSEQTDRAERITLRAALTRAAVASMRKHRRRIRVRLNAYFDGVGGPRTTASTTVTVG
jgi:hypothetical protein